MPVMVKKHATAEEYLAFEEIAEAKHEYYQGKIFAIEGGSLAHNQICRNLLGRLFAALEGTAWRLHASITLVKVAATGFYTHADLSVADASPLYESARIEVLLNPRVLIEVLSPATEDHDLGFKLKHYRKLPSVQEILFFSQVEPQVDHYIRHGDEWRLISQSGLEETVEFPSLGCQIPMRLIYADVNFPPPEVTSEEETL